MRIAASLLLLTVSSLCHGANIEFQRFVGFGFDDGTPVEDGGRFEDPKGTGSYLEFSNTENGSIIDIFLAKEDELGPFFTVSWILDEPSWFIVRFEPDFEGIRHENGPFVQSRFNPLNVPSGYPVNQDFVIPPLPPTHDKLLNFGVTLSDHCIITESPCDDEGIYRLEYSIELIPEPIPGDVNVDDKVAFDDFLILSHFFNRRRNAAHHIVGDLNNDRFINFADFNILAENFGRTRESELAAIPEPTAASLFLAGALSAVLCRRSRGRQ